jgi:hypothetical protein
MSDIKQRLTDALAKEGQKGVMGLNDAADVLLSLPGVAIVDPETLIDIANDVREDIRQAREMDDDRDRRSYLRGELHGILQCYDILTAAIKAEEQS